MVVLFKVYFNMKRPNEDTTSTVRIPLMHLV